MNSWFECKVRYEKTQENGTVKKVTEPYLVDALSFTEAETRITKEITPYMAGEFEVSDIKRVRYSEIFESTEETADKWFECKLEFITLDERSGNEKRSNSRVLVQAANLRDAMKKLEISMSTTMVDYNALSIKETALMDVYKFQADTGVENS
ncbi:DUF4494 domain-containing protein [Prevotella bivia]|jgi:hypothetical protein|uniref:DUF4494 domain-containing protein n=1 Tax=Prevotella bivia TaxID=28125 RepID=UPI0007777864|nr:DUF4494 domain-containing protein [Prevotella bivia]KXU57033.1 hypothetical protein HMPREF3218_0201686 [Prevotella bivia]